MSLEPAGPSDGLKTMNLARLMPTFSTHISPRVSSHDLSPAIASTHQTSDEIPTGASDAITQEASLVVPPHINLANVILPAGLREQSLCADLRQKVVDARNSACSDASNAYGERGAVATGTLELLRPSGRSVSVLPST